jgi:hypothetical protein
VTVVVAMAALVGCGDDDEPADATGPKDAAPQPPPTSGSEPQYRFTGTVLQSPDHGPELCAGGIADSLPPQCGGIPTVGWSWDDVEDRREQAGTTWVDSVTIVGTYDGTTFHPISSPERPTGLGGPAVDVPADFPVLCADAAVTDPGKTGIEDLDRANGVANGIDGRVAFYVSNGGAQPKDQVLNLIVTSGAAEAKAAMAKVWGGGLCVVERPEQPTEARLLEIQRQLSDELGEQVWSSWPDTQRGLVSAEVTVATPELRAKADQAFGPGLVELRAVLTPVDS